VKTLYLKDSIGGAQRSRRARSTVPDAAKQQKRASSVATSGSLQSSEVSVYSSRINERNAVSKPKMATKVTISRLCMPGMLTWTAKTQNTTG
jgi:hypothetical protein